MKLPAEHAERFRQDLAALLSLPSVAAEGRAQAETASAVAGMLAELGLQTELVPTAGAPVVLAEHHVPGRPTVLFYNHYDVQPADPLELWESDPFSLTERGGLLYGRGVSDDKGQLVSRIVALRLLKERHGGQLPVGVIFVVEGEEEIGSPNIGQFVRQHQERLRADACVWEFGGVDAVGRPQLTCGLKGIASFDLEVRTAATDQHSGRGAVIQNAAWLMAAAVASLRDAEGRVLIEGFYDDAIAPGETELHYISAAPAEDAELKQLTGVSAFLGDATGSDFQRRLQLEPVVNVNGITSGYSGPGTKTVLPATAAAKLDIRLVPGQDPHRIGQLLRQHLDRNGFASVTSRMSERPEPASRVDPAHPWVQHAAAACREVYGQEPVIVVSSGGSGPMHPFTGLLGLPVVMLGVGNADSRAHAPNENIRWEDVHTGTWATVRTIERWAGLPAS